MLNAAFDLFDDNNDGLVTARNWPRDWVACAAAGTTKVRLCFDLFDADNDGYLDEWEVRRYLRSVYRTAPGQDLLDEDGERVRPEDLAAATASTIIREADSDGDGRVSFDEFARWIASDSVEEESDSSEATTEEAITTEALYGESEEDDDDTMRPRPKKDLHRAIKP